MRTFYLFKINDDYSNLTKNIPFNLYNTYLSIKLSNKNNLSYLFNQYKSITNQILITELNKLLYLKMKDMDGYSIYRNVHMYNNYYSDEVSKLIIYNSYLILKSNKSNSTFFTVLYDIPNIFVIDFENKDYFWLDKIDNLMLAPQSNYSV
ncbi:MAG: sporulation inhibitor of replication protein SirA [Bacilli bacterium]|nr:sporulation inhibitor of replication protein SirA [Bacilli bacterium]MDD4406658.1 sporulation inhibitor of replication protein SirA [Bacilli bacterium]